MHLFSGKLKDLTKIYYSSDGTASHYKKEERYRQPASIKINLVCMLSGTTLQCHITEVHVIGLGEQLKG
jgi:hypothetical protein